MINTTTLLGILSILVAFVLFAVSFYSAYKGEKRRAIWFGVAAFLFMTVIPVTLAVFFAVPNPT